MLSARALLARLPADSEDRAALAAALDAADLETVRRFLARYSDEARTGRPEPVRVAEPWGAGWNAQAVRTWQASGRGGMAAMHEAKRS